jgi:hypothetical protein
MVRGVVEAAGLRRVSQRLGRGSYLSASNGRLHIGLVISRGVDSSFESFQIGEASCQPV